MAMDAPAIFPLIDMFPGTSVVPIFPVYPVAPAEAMELEKSDHTVQFPPVGACGPV